jgi:hypothetical protein
MYNALEAVIAVVLHRRASRSNTNAKKILPMLSHKRLAIE